MARLPAGYLSAGQRRRLSIARLIAVQRPIWLLDEPTTALDALGQAMLAELMRDHLAGGGLILAAAHGPIGLDEPRSCDWGRTMTQPLLDVPSGRRGMSALSAFCGATSGSPCASAAARWIGVLFFLIVVTLVPFALGPDLALLARIGPAILWLGALLANLLALDRLIASRSRGRLARPDPDGARAARAGARGQGARALAHHRPAAGDRRAAAGPPAQPRAEGDRRGRADLARGHAALTFIGLIGAALTVALRRGGLLLAILVLPLTIPVLIFGVAASNAAIVGPIPFGTPFSILCALTLASLVIGPLSAAIGLRQGLE